MSRIYEALRRMDLERRGAGNVRSEQIPPVEFLQSVVPEPADLRCVPTIKVSVTPASRLIALTDPQSLGAEKFRALATRLENLRNQRDLKAFQVTSSLPNEGKSLVATNLALTFARDSGAKVLLLEGDLHKPTLAMLLGQSNLRDISHWWGTQNARLSTYLYRFEDMPLWFLPAGKAFDQPSNILQSVRFAEALLQLVGTFDWIVVDSTPLLPFADVNLWSRLLDGMLLVVREGIASVRALKKGLEAIDNPSLIGVVLNDSSDFDRGHDYYKYRSVSNRVQHQI